MKKALATLKTFIIHASIAAMVTLIYYVAADFQQLYLWEQGYKWALVASIVLASCYVESGRGK